MRTLLNKTLRNHFRPLCLGIFAIAVNTFASTAVVPEVMLIYIGPDNLAAVQNDVYLQKRETLLYFLLPCTTP